MTAATSHKTRYLLFALAVAVVTLLLTMPLIPLVIAQSADYGDHVRDARLWAEAGVRLDTANRPHFLFHLLTIGAHSLTVEWNQAGAAVLVVVSGATAAVVFALLRPAFAAGGRGVLWAAAAALALMFIGPITIFTWSEQNLYFGYIPAHVYHNPTQQVLKPFALLFFACALLAFAQPRRPRPLWIALTFTVGLCATLAKPSFSICLLPAAGAVTLYRLYRRQPVDWLLLIFGVGAPVVLVLGWQYLFHRGGMGGFAFYPLQVADYLSPGSWHWKAALSLALPAAVYATYWRQAVQRQELSLAWLAFAGSAVLFYLLTEPRDWPSANFWWSAQICMFVLLVVTTTFFVQQLRAQPRQTWQSLVCMALFALHLISGLLWYVVQFDSAGIYGWW